MVTHIDYIVFSSQTFGEMIYLFDYTSFLDQCCTEVLMFEMIQDSNASRLTCLKPGLCSGGKAPMSSARCEENSTLMSDDPSN